jgi:hypothetical protein
LYQLFLLILTVLCAPILSANDNSIDPTFVFITQHQGYTCERWGQQGYKESEFEKSGYSFESLDISRNTREVKIEVLQKDSNCLYTSYFSRNKGETFVTFENSRVNPQSNCQEVKRELDHFMMQGWNYKIKRNAYMSVYFNAGIESQCANTTGKSFARFYYDILAN